MINLRELLGPVVFKTFAVHYLILGAVLIFVIVFWQLDDYFGTFSFFLPLLIGAGLWLIGQGFITKRDHHAFAALQQKQPPEPGAWTAVYGKAIALEAEKEPLFEKLLCYRYQVFEKQDKLDGATGNRRTSEKSLKLRSDGYYLVPTAIETDAGVIKLSGFPDLKQMEKRTLPSGVHTRAEEHTQSIPHYIPPFIARAITVARTRDCVDTCLKYHEESENGESEVKSWVLRTNEKVCVFGIWNHGELLPSSKRLDGLPTYEGTESEILENLKDTSSGLFAMGGFLLVVSTAWMAWYLV
ncbi:MAG: hypothetical protein AB2598_05260 [Candidatus Thiodiazotropha sp.]